MTIDDQAVSIEKKPKPTYDLMAALIATMIFFSPNFILFFAFFRDNLHIFLLYNFIIIFLLVNGITSLKRRM